MFQVACRVLEWLGWCDLVSGSVGNECPVEALLNVAQLLSTLAEDVVQTADILYWLDALRNVYGCVRVVLPFK